MTHSGLLDLSFVHVAGLDARQEGGATVTGYLWLHWNYEIVFCLDLKTSTLTTVGTAAQMKSDNLMSHAILSLVH